MRPNQKQGLKNFPEIKEAIAILINDDLTIDERKSKIELIRTSEHAAIALRRGVLDQFQEQLIDEIDNFEDASYALKGGNITASLQPKLIKWIWHSRSAAIALRYGNIADKYQGGLVEFINQSNDIAGSLATKNLAASARDALVSKMHLISLTDAVSLLRKLSKLEDGKYVFNQDKYTDKDLYNELKQYINTKLFDQNNRSSNSGNYILKDHLAALKKANVSQGLVSQLCSECNQEILKVWQEVLEYSSDSSIDFTR